jgi:chromosome partitioning protein
MSTILAIANQKGGVGKTEIAIHLTAALSRTNPSENYLLVDLDPQGHATEGVGLKELYDKQGVTLHEGLMQTGVDVSTLIHQVPQESFYLLPSHYQMMTIEQDLSGPKVYNRERRLANLLEEMAEAFDWIIIDCPPNLGLLTDNAIIASRRLIVPVQAEQTSVRALELLLDQIESLERELKFTVDILTLVPNLVQDSKLARRILGGMRQNLPITDFAFPKRVILQEAYEAGRTIFTYEPDRSKREDASELQGLFMQLAQLVRERTASHGQ